MIPKPLKEVSYDDKVAESKDIEYKRELPGGADGDKHKFLATICSFANTAGGDLLLGMEEDNGIPIDRPGMKIDDLNKEVLRVDHMILNGLEPRITSPEFHPIKTPDGKFVLAIRVRRSWISPHRVKANGKFYARAAKGRYEMDVGQLRTAFTLAESIADRIRLFRTNRTAKILAGDAPVPLGPRGRIVLHVVPMSAFADPPSIDLAGYLERGTMLRRCSWRIDNHKFNLDGIVTSSNSAPNPSLAYIQLFRTGAVECVEVIDHENSEVFEIHPRYERNINEFLRFNIPILREIGAQLPIYVFVSFVDASGCELGRRPTAWHRTQSSPLTENVVLLPEAVIQDFDAIPEIWMRPVYDAAWNAFGYPRSYNYNDEGDWTGNMAAID